MSSKADPSSRPSAVPEPASDRSSSASSTMKEERAAAAAGMQFTKSGRYQLLETLGSGGMGVVHKALDQRLGRFVAIKRLSQALVGDGEQLELFLREARVLAQLRHFNLPEIYDIDEDADGPFISMEFISGKSTMQQLKEKGKLDARSVLEIGEGVCGALEAAHRRNIIHRDIKPSNILVTLDGVPKLIDFGIANAGLSAGGHNLAVDNTIAGTPSYSSPEQRADAAKADRRSDVYSLAATLYALITGESPATVREQLLAPEVRPLLMKGLARDPAQRWPTADEFGKAVRKQLDDWPNKDSSRILHIAEDERPLLERLRDEVRKLMDTGQFQEAAGVWERIGRLIKNEKEVARVVEQCRARVREREVRRLLGNISRFGELSKFDEADGVVKEIFKIDPGNAEAVYWRDSLAGRRQDVVKKLFYDAKNHVFKGDFDMAEQALAKAASLNRDPDMRPKIASLAAVAAARTEMKSAARDADLGDRAASLEHVAKAREHLQRAIGLPKTDPIFADLEKLSGTVTVQAKRSSQAVLYWMLLAAAAPGLALFTLGPAFWGGAGLVWGAVISGPLMLAVASLFFLWTPGDAKAGGLSALVDGIAAKQDDNGLITKIALGAVGVMFVVVIAAGIITSLMTVAQGK